MANRKSLKGHGAQGRCSRYADYLRASRRAIFKLTEMILFTLIIALLFLILLQVFSRYVLEVSLPWTEESARVVLLWSVMIGAAVAMDRHEHYSITIISARLPQSADWIVALLVNFVGLAFLATFLYFGVEYTESGMRMMYVSLGMPRGWGYVALPVGAALMSFALLCQSVEILLTKKTVTSASTREEAENP